MKTLQIAENRIFAIKPFANCGKRQIVGVVGGHTPNNGYHVYVVVQEATVGQTLPCEQEGGNAMHDSSAIATAESNDPPIDNDALVLSKNFPG